MAKFRNNETGNTLNVKNEKAVALMEASERYTRVTETIRETERAGSKKNVKSK